MRSHVEEFSAQVTAKVTVSYGADVRSAAVDADSVLSAAVIAAGLPIEQPCAGRGTCLKCKVMAEGALSPLDEHELHGLTPAERAAHYRLACRARVIGNVAVTLAPIVVYSNKIFRASNDHKRPGVPLGLAIDLGSTTVAAFVVTLDTGKVCAGAAALNQQTAFGADVISRLAAAQLGPETAERVSALALSSIVQAVDALNLTPRIRARIRKVTIVGNCAMHHLLLRYPVDTLAELPFQPYSILPVRYRGQDGGNPFAGIFPSAAEVALPPLIGGFVGSDALACLVYYGFDRALGPMAAIDLGTNGEVLVTDGTRILVASTAAGPAFEGVNITSGTRAVDGAIIGVKADPTSDTLALTTIGDQPPAGLTGSGLLSLVHELRRAGVVDQTGRLVTDPPAFGDRMGQDEEGVRRFLITDKGVNHRGIEEGGEDTEIPLYLTQHDIRELQKAKGAIRAAMDTLLARLGLHPGDLRRMILTGSFGSQLDSAAVVGLGMIPPVAPDVVESSANGAGFGAALMLDDAEFARGERIAAAAEQIDLDMDPDFDRRYIDSLKFAAEGDR
ncbi:MAG: ASKHA domain-containing protein [Chloroflexi bacterium]|nr:ASKHA domain-containing protein [Chloroflexota bacterium]